MKPRLPSVLLFTALLGCRPAPTTPRAIPSPRDAVEVMNWIRDNRRGIQLGPHASDVSLFVVSSRKPSSAEQEPTCPEPVSPPADIRTILPAPDFSEVYASSNEGTLLHHVDRTWTAIPTPEALPPIQALLGLVRNETPPQMVVAAGTDSELELWTMVIEDRAVTSAQPTAVDGPEFADAAAFFQAYHTPSCREDDRDCLAWVEVDARTHVSVAGQHDAESRHPLLELTTEGTLVDVAWADPDGDTVYLAAKGTPCLVSAAR